MKAVEAFMVCKVYGTPISLTNRAPPAVLAAVLVTLYSTPSIPPIADRIAKEDKNNTKLAISLLIVAVKKKLQLQGHPGTYIYSKMTSFFGSTKSNAPTVFD